jgi:hypothetical protein
MDDEPSAGAVEAVDGGAVARAAQPVPEGAAPDQLALDALDRWIVDLGDDEADLRAQLRQARERLGAEP